ncbi:hypothetical protein HHI36_001104 [Cryptolaemus montrouzieri]|uniref:Uncharacterized protein n=1 Tax=Cryptolaemus montrouzieri TaxID=559131 RepID=A0ABD2P6N5_9CUCU
MTKSTESLETIELEEISTESLSIGPLPPMAPIGAVEATSEYYDEEEYNFSEVPEFQHATKIIEEPQENLKERTNVLEFNNIEIITFRGAETFLPPKTNFPIENEAINSIENLEEITFRPFEKFPPVSKQRESEYAETVSGNSREENSQLQNSKSYHKTFTEISRRSSESPLIEIKVHRPNEEVLERITKISIPTTYLKTSLIAKDEENIMYALTEKSQKFSASKDHIEVATKPRLEGEKSTKIIVGDLIKTESYDHRSMAIPFNEYLEEIPLGDIQRPDSNQFKTTTFAIEGEFKELSSTRMNDWLEYIEAPLNESSREDSDASLKEPDNLGKVDENILIHSAQNLHSLNSKFLESRKLSKWRRKRRNSKDLFNLPKKPSPWIELGETPSEFKMISLNSSVPSEIEFKILEGQTTEIANAIEEVLTNENVLEAPASIEISTILPQLEIIGGVNPIESSTEEPELLTTWEIFSRTSEINSKIDQLTVIAPTEKKTPKTPSNIEDLIELEKNIEEHKALGSDLPFLPTTQKKTKPDTFHMIHPSTQNTHEIENILKLQNDLELSETISRHSNNFQTANYADTRATSMASIERINTDISEEKVKLNKFEHKIENSKKLKIHPTEDTELYNNSLRAIHVEYSTKENTADIRNLIELQYDLESATESSSVFFVALNVTPDTYTDREIDKANVSNIFSEYNWRSNTFISIEKTTESLEKIESILKNEEDLEKIGITYGEHTSSPSKSDFRHEIFSETIHQMNVADSSIISESITTPSNQFDNGVNVESGSKIFKSYEYSLSSTSFYTEKLLEDERNIEELLEQQTLFIEEAQISSSMKSSQEKDKSTPQNLVTTALGVSILFIPSSLHQEDFSPSIYLDSSFSESSTATSDIKELFFTPLYPSDVMFSREHTSSKISEITTISRPLLTANMAELKNVQTSQEEFDSNLHHLPDKSIETSTLCEICDSSTHSRSEYITGESYNQKYEETNRNNMREEEFDSNLFYLPESHQTSTVCEICDEAINTVEEKEESTATPRELLFSEHDRRLKEEEDFDSNMFNIAEQNRETSTICEICDKTKSHNSFTSIEHTTVIKEEFTRTIANIALNEESTTIQNGKEEPFNNMLHIPENYSQETSTICEICSTEEEVRIKEISMTTAELLQQAVTTTETFLRSNEAITATYIYEATAVEKSIATEDEMMRSPENLNTVTDKGIEAAKHIEEKLEQMMKFGVMEITTIFHTFSSMNSAKEMEPLEITTHAMSSLYANMFSNQTENAETKSQLNEKLLKYDETKSTWSTEHTSFISTERTNLQSNTTRKIAETFATLEDLTKTTKHFTNQRVQSESSVEKTSFEVVSKSPEESWTIENKEHLSSNTKVHEKTSTEITDMSQITNIQQFPSVKLLTEIVLKIGDSTMATNVYNTEIPISKTAMESTTGTYGTFSMTKITSKFDERTTGTNTNLEGESVTQSISPITIESENVTEEKRIDKPTEMKKVYESASILFTDEYTTSRTGAHEQSVIASDEIVADTPFYTEEIIRTVNHQSSEESAITLSSNILNEKIEEVERLVNNLITSTLPSVHQLITGEMRLAKNDTVDLLEQELQELQQGFEKMIETTMSSEDLVKGIGDLISTTRQNETEAEKNNEFYLSKIIVESSSVPTSSFEKTTQGTSKHIKSTLATTEVGESTSLEKIVLSPTKLYETSSTSPRRMFLKTEGVNSAFTYTNSITPVVSLVQPTENEPLEESSFTLTENKDENIITSEIYTETFASLLNSRTTGKVDERVTEISITIKEPLTMLTTVTIMIESLASFGEERIVDSSENKKKDKSTSEIFREAYISSTTGTKEESVIISVEDMTETPFYTEEVTQMVKNIFSNQETETISSPNISDNKIEEVVEIVDSNLTTAYPSAEQLITAEVGVVEEEKNNYLEQELQELQDEFKRILSTTMSAEDLLNSNGYLILSTNKLETVDKEGSSSFPAIILESSPSVIHTSEETNKGITEIYDESLKTKEFSGSTALDIILSPTHFFETISTITSAEMIQETERIISAITQTNSITSMKFVQQSTETELSEEISFFSTENIGGNNTSSEISTRPIASLINTSSSTRVTNIMGEHTTEINTGIEEMSTIRITVPNINESPTSAGEKGIEDKYESTSGIFKEAHSSSTTAAQEQNIIISGGAITETPFYTEGMIQTVNPILSSERTDITLMPNILNDKMDEVIQVVNSILTSTSPLVSQLITNEVEVAENEEDLLERELQELQNDFKQMLSTTMSAEDLVNGIQDLISSSTKHQTEEEGGGTSFSETSLESIHTTHETFSELNMTPIFTNMIVTVGHELLNKEMKITTNTLNKNLEDFDKLVHDLLSSTISSLNELETTNTEFGPSNPEDEDLAELENDLRKLLNNTLSFEDSSEVYEEEISTRNELDHSNKLEEQHSSQSFDANMEISTTEFEESSILLHVSSTMQVLSSEELIPKVVSETSEKHATDEVEISTDLKTLSIQNLPTTLEADTNLVSSFSTISTESKKSDVTFTQVNETTHINFEEQTEGDMKNKMSSIPILTTLFLSLVTSTSQYSEESKTIKGQYDVTSHNSNIPKCLIVFLSGENTNQICLPLNGTKWVPSESAFISGIEITTSSLISIGSEYSSEKTTTTNEIETVQRNVTQNIELVTPTTGGANITSVISEAVTEINMVNNFVEGGCTEADFENNNNCFCMLDLTVDHIIEGLGSNNSSTFNVKCSNFLKVERGLIIHNQTQLDVKRTKRSYLYMRYLNRQRRELVEYNRIDEVLANELTAKSTDMIAYAALESTASLPCIYKDEMVEKEHFMKYVWTSTGDKSIMCKF